MEIVKREERVHEVAYYLVFNWSDNPGSGFSFPCDVDGNVDEASLPPAGRENYKKCLDGTHHVERFGVAKSERWIRVPAIGLCDACHAEVVLRDSFTNACGACGIEYNGSGQHLAPRSQWGDETGETVADMFGPPPVGW